MNPRQIIGFTERDFRSPAERKSQDRKKLVKELIKKGHTRARAIQLAKQH